MKKAGIFYPCFFGKIPAFWRKKRGFCFFALLKTERSSFFCCFPCFFPHYPRFFFLANPRFFRKKAGKGGSGKHRKEARAGPQKRREGRARRRQRKDQAEKKTPGPTPKKQAPTLYWQAITQKQTTSSDRKSSLTKIYPKTEAKKGRTLSERGDAFRKKILPKNGQHFPLPEIKNQKLNPNPSPNPSVKEFAPEEFVRRNGG